MWVKLTPQVLEPSPRSPGLDAARHVERHLAELAGGVDVAQVRMRRGQQRRVEEPSALVAGGHLERAQRTIHRLGGLTEGAVGVAELRGEVSRVEVREPVRAILVVRTLKRAFG